MKILAAASGGGHWVELQRVIKAFEGHRVAFMTVAEAYRQDVAGCHVYIVNDATRWNPIGLLWLVCRTLRVVLSYRPDVIISTGAAPGCLAIICGRMFGAKTIWLDSLANVDRLSLSGILVRRFAHLWLTQWPHLAKEEGPECAGQVL